MELGKRIAEIRKEHSLTQEGLAEICNVTRQTISNWENGKSYPDLETLVLMSNVSCFTFMHDMHYHSGKHRPLEVYHGYREQNPGYQN